MKFSNAIELIRDEYRQCLHFSKYPQDKYKDKDIKVLIQTAEYNAKLAEEYKQAMDVLSGISNS